MECPPAVSQRDRLYQIYGERADLVELHKEAAGMKLTGFVAALAEQGPTRGPQNLFINRRIVKDRTIAHAIIDSYSQASIKERSPEVHLFIEMPPDALDVNVHPTKAEVRFREQSLVHEVVRRAFMETLARSGAPQLQLRPEHAPQVTFAPALPGVLAGGVFPNRWQPVTHAGETVLASPGQGLALPSPSDAAQRFSGDGTAAAPEIRPMIPLGQFRDTFIIAVDDEGLAIIDQHVAHERVLFERVMERLTRGPLESQRLLVPMLLDVPAAARQTLLARRAELERFGFDVADFGGTTLTVTAAPALLGAEESANALRALAEDLEGLDRGAQVQDALQRIAATTACHAAVKANDRLTYEKMAHILSELRATAYSTVCPHGRPVMLRLTRREIEKNFDRI
jgi:DNA mismatch repair protein MutL